MKTKKIENKALNVPFRSKSDAKRIAVLKKTKAKKTGKKK